MLSMLRKKGQKGFTLIELLIVIAIIGILAAIAIPMYRAQTVKAKLTEVTNAVSHVSTGLMAYRNENGNFPVLDSVMAINNTLGVGVSNVAASRVGDMATDVNGVITASGIKNIGAPIDGKTLVMTPTVADSAHGGGITWDWTASSIPVQYLPKK